MTKEEIAELDLELDSLVGDESPHQPDGDAAVKRVQAAMKDVKHEMLLVDEDGTSHIAYIMGMQMQGPKLQYDFSTPSEDKEKVARLIDECISAIGRELLQSDNTPKSLWNKLKIF